jgi:ribosomal protein S18 acetylase RimI-like enzyme
MIIDIRQATVHDAALVADLSRQTFFDTYASQNTKEDMDKFLSDQFSRETLMKEVGTPGNIFLLAFAGDEVLGYVRMRDGDRRPEFNERSSIEIARIYTVHRVAGKGVGSAMMKKCIGIANDLKREIIWLGVWKQNLRAIQFYIKWGFEKFAEHDFVLGNDVQQDWLMKREVIQNFEL